MNDAKIRIAAHFIMAILGGSAILYNVFFSASDSALLSTITKMLIIVWCVNLLLLLVSWFVYFSSTERKLDVVIKYCRKHHIDFDQIEFHPNRSVVSIFSNGSCVKEISL